MLMRAYLARWSVFGVSAVAALAACSDESPSISAPQERIETVNTSLSALGGIPTGKTVVVFKDTAAVPASGVTKTLPCRALWIASHSSASSEVFSRKPEAPRGKRLDSST